MSSESKFSLDKKQVRHSFSHAADTYDESAVLQREVANRMLERLSFIRFVPETILDIGAGTGYVTQGLMNVYSKAHVVSLDLSDAMLQQTRKRFSSWKPWARKPALVCADAEQLPLQDESVDMIFSSLTLQWCNDLDATLKEFRRVLKPGGMLMFSTFGPDTLKELRMSWSAVDQTPHVSEFIDMHDIGDAMVHAQLAEPVMDAEHFTLTYDKVSQLMRDLKNIGASNASSDRSKGLTGKSRMQKMQQAYEEYRSDGLLPATYEVIYGHAWAGTRKANEVSLSMIQNGQGKKT